MATKTHHCYLMNNLPIYVDALFLFCIITTALFFWKATHYSKSVIGLILAWLVIQSIPSIMGFYQETQSLPPRFLLLVAPPILTVLYLIISKRGQVVIDRWDSKTLTYLHVVRIPVEITLLLLFLHGYVPELMTFEGRNFDILSGISALVVGYLMFNRKSLNKHVFLIWNFLCLALLFNIVFHGVLSVPTPFQQFAFDQPNVALTYFPFTLLPGFVVPVVLLSHLVLIRKHLK